jgi:hypothetical protein
MKAESAKTLVRVLGGFSLFLSCACLCFNGWSILSSIANPMLMGPMQAAGEKDRAEIQEQIGDLEQEREQTSDPGRLREIDSEIQGLRLAEQMINIYSMMSGEDMKGFLAFSISDTIINLLLNLAFLAGGVGLLVLAPWGRRVSLIVAILKILATIIYSLLFVFVFWPVMTEVMTSTMESIMVVPPGGSGPPPEFLEVMMEIGGILVALITILAGCLYPVALLVLLNLREVKECLSRSGVPESIGMDEDGAPSQFP